ncbi:alpha/beta fold hydrolase [Zobellia galactanivorans]|uniref:Alpha/beta hydrolase-fold protein n=1 Tax=Zobellia galactanivorans (strain DSM 12802 / CCUG 47099 / CIP 106680 / NCIMB 13871 / Dsij) TaxID=63186 RepID=G0L5Y5_ZOBGA|nr:alpha/beta fold hydrolase [Zobellia galactanivorans]MDO6807153.1 alpha/beta fold hydrolase [Zobellia galactanivorans]CAZ96602.1 Alpha/beta hydrolase-fold protein [Zobellia galactanivorans]
MTTLHSKIIGKGSPLLILHGFLGMSDNWKTLGGQYAEAGFEVHLIDQRNHGKSFWSDDFDYDLLAEDLKAYMEAHHLDRAAIIGHSMGGKTAMQFACSYPELTDRILIADIAPKFYPPHHQAIIDGLNALRLETMTSRNEADAALGQYITDFGTRQFLLKNLYWVEKGQLGFRFNLKVLSQKMNEIGENINPTDMYNGPTLFLRGDKSEYIMPNDLTEIKKHFPQAELQTIDRAGHWLHAENPKQFFEKSLAFLKG